MILMLCPDHLLLYYILFIHCSLFSSSCYSIHIFPEMTAEISDKLIHVCHISVLVSFLVYGAVNNVVCLTLYGERQICKQHGYPEFLKDGVFRVATKIGQSDLFFDKFVIFLHRPS